MIDEIRTTTQDENGVQMKCRVTFACWVKLYLYGLLFFSWLMRTEPDYEKAADIMMAGAKVEVENE